ncbi:MAG TPA: AMP-binding protein, partial [Acidimicrobiia bacterium]
EAIPESVRPRPAIVLDAVTPEDGSTADRLAALPASDLTDADRRAPLRPGHAAYVIYTSGSTGRPKGVVVPHSGVAKLIATQTERLRVTGESRVLQFASPSFDLAFWELVQAFGSGACLVVVPAERRVAGPELTEYLAVQRVTHMALPPSVLTALPADTDLPPDSTLLCGTEAVPPEVVARFSTGRRMFNAYGPTEATVNSTLWECPPGHRGPVPIGHPDPQMTAYVLDDALRLCLPGAPGELYIGGAGLARCYHRQPGLTATRFVADPYGPPGGLLYRTGDRARWKADGAIEFLGRVDDQVKISGFRIEPGEVEVVLESHPDVARAVVVARDDDGVRRLVGYVTAAPASADAVALRSFLADRLPPYMVPAAIVVLDAFPVSPNNKVDRTALPAPDFAALASGREPVTSDERALAALFAEVLGLERVGADDDFFALGGHSLLAARLVTRIRAALGREVPLRDLFDAPTVAGLAARLPAAGTGHPAVGRPPLRPRPRPDRLPLAPVQRGLWKLYRMEGPSPTYNIASAVRFRGELDHDALWLALGDLVERHEPLRTAFPFDADGPYQLVLPASPPILRVEPCRRDRVDDRLARLAAHPFDLVREAPFQAHVLRVGDREHVVSLVVHHIVSDGWSEAALIDDLITAYEARKAGRAPDWDPLPVSYADYTLWYHELLAAGPADDQLAYWREALADLPEEIPLPADRPRPARPNFTGGSVDLDIPPGLHRRLRDLAAARCATMFMV